jgi:hypothetical protein
MSVERVELVRELRRSRPWRTSQGTRGGTDAQRQRSSGAESGRKGVGGAAERSSNRAMDRGGGTTKSKIKAKSKWVLDRVRVAHSSRMTGCGVARREGVVIRAMD